MAKVTGRAGIEQFFGVMEGAKAVLTVTPTIITVGAAGDIALEEGTWTYSFPISDSVTAKDNGKYLVAWKKVDGTWLMQTDIWNSDNPPQPMPAAAPCRAPRMRRLVPALIFAVALSACRPHSGAGTRPRRRRPSVPRWPRSTPPWRPTTIPPPQPSTPLDRCLSFLPPNQGRQTGTAYLEQMLAGLKPLKATFVVTPVTIVIAASGDLAVEEEGTGRRASRPPTAPPSRTTGSTWSRGGRSTAPG